MKTNVSKTLEKPLTEHYGALKKPLDALNLTI